MGPVLFWIFLLKTAFKLLWSYSQKNSSIYDFKTRFNRVWIFISLRSNAPQVRVTSEQKLCTNIIYIVMGFCATNILNIFSKEIISNNTKRRKQICNRQFTTTCSPKIIAPSKRAILNLLMKNDICLQIKLDQSLRLSKIEIATTKHLETKAFVLWESQA